jgi:hypothetical protein
MTFPLPLTPFEEYALCDGTPSHPLEFFYRLSFDGPLDPRAVATAAAEAFRRHPLLAVHIDDRTGSTPRFVPGAAPPVPMIEAEAADDLPPIPALDEAKGPLARLFLVERPAGTSDVLAQFHHVACDGLGALAFLADFCVLLDAALRNAAADLAPPNPSTLRRRGRYGLDSWKLVRSLPAQARGLEGVWKFLRHRPARFAPEGEPGPERLHRIQRADAWLEANEARSLRRAATSAGVSVNELAAAALFRALREALPAAAFSHPHAVVRLSIPINMRGPAERRLPAANVVSMVFLDRRPAEIDAAVLEASLHAEMQLIKRLGLGMTFLFTLAAARLLPGGIPRLVGDRSTAATALFTNLGRIFLRAADRRTGLVRVGRHALVAVEPLAPLRRGTALAMAAVEYGGHLRFTLRTDPAALDAAATEALAAAFARHLRCHLPAATEHAAAEPAPVAAEACA